MNRFQILDNTPVEPFKIFTIDYWTKNINSITPVVNSYSYHFWVYIAFIAFLVGVAMAFRIYKGKYLNQKTLDLLNTENDPKNPIYSKFSFFENYYMVGAYLFTFFFLARQATIAILSNKLFILAIFGYLIVGAVMAIRYFMTDKPIDEAFFRSNKTL
jgi:hypothetical protein